MPQGNYDHPSYLTRTQVVLGNTTAGASGTSLVTNFTNQMRLRNVMATVVTAGTTSGSASKVDIFVGTASVGTITLSTNTANSTGTTGDLNTIVAAATQVFVKNGTDATAVARIVAEMHVDPSATWLGAT